jgi:hypothetical protein
VATLGDDGREEKETQGRGMKKSNGKKLAKRRGEEGND